MVVALFLSILRYSLQYMFMLAFELVRPGGSLSTLLIATPYWQDASRRVFWQVAMAAYKLQLDDDGATSWLLGGYWQRQQGVSSS
jgi:hypothetical protein